MSGAITGLGSGLDVNSIISQLVSVARSPIVRNERDISKIDARYNGLQQVSNLLASLRSAAQGVRDTSLWSASQTLTSSNEAVAKVTGSGVPAGGHTVEVLSLARAQQLAAGVGFTTAGANDTLQIQVGAGGPTAVSISAGDDLSTIASKINQTANVGVFAAVINNRLYINSSTTGAANTVSVTSGGGVATAMGLTQTVAASDASYKINGSAPQSSTTNQITDALPGASITLTGIGTATINASASQVDPSKVADRMQAFVEAYNAAIKGSYERMRQKPVDNPQTQSDLTKGALFGNSSLRSTISTLRSIPERGEGGGPYSTFRDLGIAPPAQAGEDANMGLLVFDREKFLTAYNADPAATKQLLDNATGNVATEGLTQFVERTVNNLIGSGGTLAAAISGESSQKQALKDRGSRLEARLTAYEAKLKAQFSRLDTILGRLNNQNSYVSGQISRMMSSSS